MKVRTKNLKGSALKFALELTGLRSAHPEKPKELLFQIAKRNTRLIKSKSYPDVETLGLISKTLGESIEVPEEFL